MWQSEVPEAVDEGLHALFQLLKAVYFPENEKRVSLLGAGVPGRPKTHAELSPMLCILQGDYIGQGGDTIVPLTIFTQRDTNFFSCETGLSEENYHISENGRCQW